MAPTWLNPAGGLRYHLRASFAGSAWQPFRDQLGAWLAGFEPSSDRALLVGPSAGYTFPDAFLRRFREITVLEPDPIAARLLVRRLRRLGLDEPRVERQDQLIRPLLGGGPGLPELLAEDDARCLVFGNLLGQVRFLMPDDDLERFKAAFASRIGPRLAGRAWLSFHDRVSSRVAPMPAPTLPYDAPSRLGDAELGALYPEGPGSVELFDHASDGLLPRELPHRYLHWPIDSRHHHLIEAVMSRR